MLHTKFRENLPAAYPTRLHIKFGFDRPGQAVLEKKMFEIVYDDGRTPDHEYPISSPISLWLR